MVLFKIDVCPPMTMSVQLKHCAPTGRHNLICWCSAIRLSVSLCLMWRLINLYEVSVSDRCFLFTISDYSFPAAKVNVTSHMSPIISQTLLVSTFLNIDSLVYFLRVQTWLHGKTTICKVTPDLSIYSDLVPPLLIAGTGCEMYTETLSPSFTGMSFSQASE